MWSAACCFYELYTGSFLFNGQTNNQMLKAHMDLLGPVPKRLLKKAHFASLHFDENYVFMHVEYNKITDKVFLITILFIIIFIIIFIRRASLD
jgi:serine/threonine-protein kinase PRP4